MIQEDETEKRRELVIKSLARASNTDILTEPGQLYAQIDIETDERLTDEMRELLTDIRTKFKPETDVADRCVLYEVTNYKDNKNCPEDFWDLYTDFAELGNDEKLVNVNKMDTRALPKEIRDEYMAERLRNRYSRQVSQNLDNLLQPSNNSGGNQVNLGI